MEEYEYYEIEKILDDKIVDNQHWFKVKWSGNGNYKNDWVKITDFKNFDNIITNYNNEKERLKKLEEIDTSLDNIIKNDYMKNNNFLEKLWEIQKENKNYGNTINGDRVLKIHRAEKYNKEIILLVEWKTRHNNEKPLNSIIKNIELYDFDPTSLIDFYESRIQTIN